MAKEDLKPVLPTVVSQEGALVGDDKLPEPEPFKAEVEQREDDAQVAAKPERPADKVQVFEVVVETDKVITDPSSPLAVQVPDAGRGSLLLPIHQHIGSVRAEDVFAEESPDEPEQKSEAEALQERTAGEPAGR